MGAERQREDAERAREAAERQRYETERVEQARRRRNGEVAIATGLVLTGGGIAIGATLGAGSTESNNTADWIGLGMLVVGLFGLVPYGTFKIIYNPELGPFKPTPAPTATKGVAFTFSF